MQNKEEICRFCKTSFSFVPKRGRQPKACMDCRKAKARNALDQRLIDLGIDIDFMIEDKRKRQDTLPKPTLEDLSGGLLSAKELELLLQEETNVDIDKTKLARITNMNHIEVITTMPVVGRERVDRLDMMLRSRGTHIAQHRSKWE